MTEVSIPTAAGGGPTATGDREWNWQPSLPLENGPLFVWPPRPLKAAQWLVGLWLPFTDRTAILLIAGAAWFFCHPALAQCQTLAFDWIAQIYLRNLALTILVAGGLHLYLFRFARQGPMRKFEAKDPTGQHRRFTFGSQLLDNMVWTLASGVTVLSAYEVAMMWAMANGYLPTLAWEDNPVWFVVWFLLIPHWSSFHFYWVHRLLHWPPLYRLAHSLHHRNITVGPWSGFSFHPIEHLIFVSSVLIHLLVASHPLHLIFHLQYKSLLSVTAHAGFEKLLLTGKKGMALGDYFHQLHHRHFECNYGSPDIPLDKWFGTFHDGSETATRHTRERLRALQGAA